MSRVEGSVTHLPGLPWLPLQMAANCLHEKQKVGTARRMTFTLSQVHSRLSALKGVVRYPMTNNLRLTITKKSSNVVLKFCYNCMVCQATSCFIEKSFESKCPLDREQTVFLFGVQEVFS